MHKFSFRLRRVLEYRELVEGWAKDAYLDARAQRLAAEEALADIQNMRSALIESPVADLPDRLALETALNRIDDDDRAQRALIATLAQEEETLLADWILRRQELEALVKLRDRSFTEWQYQANREEQNALDEWATTRRTA